MLSVDKVRVVIIGQNPYNAKPNMANGIAFSVDSGTSATLNTINKELVRSYGTPLRDYTLKHWMDQGVLLLNATFTINLKDTECDFNHADLWTFFTENLVYWISRHTTHNVFLLWGTMASRYTRVLKGSDVTVIKSPFPLERASQQESFVGSDTFVKCNKALIKLGKLPIEWV